MRHRDDVEIRERAATMKSLSLFGWYRILALHCHLCPHASRPAVNLRLPRKEF